MWVNEISTREIMRYKSILTGASGVDQGMWA